jgi:hypothetical protein
MLNWRMDEKEVTVDDPDYNLLAELMKHKGNCKHHLSVQDQIMQYANMVKPVDGEGEGKTKEADS